MVKKEMVPGYASLYDLQKIVDRAYQDVNGTPIPRISAEQEGRSGLAVVYRNLEVAIGMMKNELGEDWKEHCLPNTRRVYYDISFTLGVLGKFTQLATTDPLQKKNLERVSCGPEVLHRAEEIVLYQAVRRRVPKHS